MHVCTCKPSVFGVEISAATPSSLRRRPHSSHSCARRRRAHIFFTATCAAPFQKQQHVCFGQQHEMHGQHERMQPPRQQQSKQQNGVSFFVTLLTTLEELTLLFMTMTCGCGAGGATAMPIGATTGWASTKGIVCTVLCRSQSERATTTSALFWGGRGFLPFCASRWAACCAGVHSLCCGFAVRLGTDAAAVGRGRREASTTGRGGAARGLAWESRVRGPPASEPRVCVHSFCF